MKKRRKSTATNEPLNRLEAEIAITALHATGDYLVLRRLDLDRDNRFTHRSTDNSLVGLCLDTETTGFSYVEDKIIEIGMVAFEFNPATAEIIRITGRYAGFEDPGFPLPDEVRQVTGITDDMLAGQRFANDRVNALACQASLVIAHNAAFDRRFVERRFAAFSTLPWACTLSQIDWQAERIASRSLEYLLYKTGGWCINAHRALDDAEGVLGLLLEKLPTSGSPVFRTLLAKSREETSRVCAAGAPFEKKDMLKQRGYRWSDGSSGRCKGWWKDVAAVAEGDELDYLAKEIYPHGDVRQVAVRKIDAVSRFSVRED